MRVLDILELGDGLRRQAEDSCDNVNAAHLLVHEVMLRAFGDAPGSVAAGVLQAELSSRLAVKLGHYAAGRA
jgi:hypothetical protein